mmetsp:Transcript_43308/g.85461  ORF Transcript_43308/g.85461 Transcript_43308/m.85461 type:complete len:217 (-) Transcript_43308:1219-1869(-)
MPARKFVPNLRSPRLSEHKLQSRVSPLVFCQDHAINICRDRNLVLHSTSPHSGRMRHSSRTPSGPSPCESLHSPHGNVSIGINLIIRDHLPHPRDAVLVQGLVLLPAGQILEVGPPRWTFSLGSLVSWRGGWGHEDVHGAVRVISVEGHVVPPKTDGSPKPPVQRGLVHDRCVLDVIRRVGHDRQGRVLSGREVIEAHQLHRSCLDERLLGVHEEV